GQFGMTNLSYDSSRNIDNWKFYVKENYSSNGGYSGRNYLAYFVTKSFNKPTTFYISVGKLEKGTKATDLTPAPEDTDAKITSNTTLIEQNADGLKLKANQDTVDTLAGTVQSLGTEFDIVAGQVSSRVWNTDIETAIDGIEVGGRNLVQDSHFDGGNVNGWSSIYGTQVVEEGIYKKTFTSLLNSARLEKTFKDLEVGEYTFTIFAKTPVDLQWRGFGGADVVKETHTASPDAFKRYSITFNVVNAGDVTIRAYVPKIPVGSVVEIDWEK